MIKSGFSPVHESSSAGKLVRRTADKVLKNHGLNNSTGKYDKFVNKMYNLYKETLHDEKELEKVLERELAKMYPDLKESVEMNEAKYDGDTINWKKIKVGDVVGITLEGFNRLPKVGTKLRVGPFSGTCERLSGSKVFMKVEADHREEEDSEEMNEATEWHNESSKKRELEKTSKDLPHSTGRKWFEIRKKRYLFNIEISTDSSAEEKYDEIERKIAPELFKYESDKIYFDDNILVIDVTSYMADMNESTEMNEGIRFSDRKIQQKIYTKYKEVAKVPPRYPAKAYTADTFEMWYEYMLDKGFIKSDFLNESEEMNEASGRHPKLGKKVKQLKGWKIYQGTDNQGDEIFRCFTPDDDYPAVGYEDWECETLEQAISWIQNY